MSTPAIGDPPPLVGLLYLHHQWVKILEVCPQHNAKFGRCTHIVLPSITLNLSDVINLVIMSLSLTLRLMCQMYSCFCPHHLFITLFFARCTHVVVHLITSGNVAKTKCQLTVNPPYNCMESPMTKPMSKNSVYLSIRLSTHHYSFVCLFVHPFSCHLSVHPSICPPTNMLQAVHKNSVHLFDQMRILFICKFIHRPFCLYVFLSICLSVCQTAFHYSQSSNETSFHCL